MAWRGATDMGHLRPRKTEDEMELVVEQIECADAQGQAVSVFRVRDVETRVSRCGSSYWSGPDHYRDDRGRVVQPSGAEVFSVRYSTEAGEVLTRTCLGRGRAALVHP